MPPLPRPDVSALLRRSMNTPFDAPAFLQSLTGSRYYREQISAAVEIPAREANFGELSAPLPDALQTALNQLLSTQDGENARLFSHQAQAIESGRRGENFVVVSGTASGKTLCYHLPILETLLNQKGARALYLYPTKALAQDQLRGLTRLLEAAQLPFRCGTYDGDTPSTQRSALRDKGDLLLTNPDMLHAGILPQHAKWAHFFENLRYLVIDEVHSYRGIFGSNFANVLRRLKRICAHYGSAPQFLCASATIANPQELCENLCGAPFTLIDDDGAPRGTKHFVLWNPPLLGAGREAPGTGDELLSTQQRPDAPPLPAPSAQSPAPTERRSANSEAMHLLVALMRAGAPTIAFVKARVVAELLLRYTQDELSHRAPQLLERVRSYRGGYLATERREIERQLFAGELLGVIATSALELGIDVGALDACLMVGYPGSIASLWQRAGRAGRSGGSSLALLVASENPIDQYLMHHPDYLFGRAAENAVLDADNAYILAKHLRCACAELPVSLGEARVLSEYAPALLQLLEEENQLRRAGDAWFWARSGSPSRDVSLRNAGDEAFTIFDVERGQIIGTIDEATAYQMVHNGAIYLHEADTFFIENLDLETRTAKARRSETDYFTQAISEAQIRIESTDEEKMWRDCAAGFGAATVTMHVTSFKKIKFGSLDSLGFAPLELPPQELDTVSMWLQAPPESLRKLREYSRSPLEALLGIANATLGVLPLRVLCDGADIGAVVDSAQLGSPALFLFDKYPGGLGFAQRAYDLLPDVMTAAHQIIAECACEEGCPSCVGSAAKTFTYYDAGGEARARIPDKEAALVVLHDMLGLEPYVPRFAATASTQEPIPQLPPQVEDKVRRQLQRMKGKL